MSKFLTYEDRLVIAQLLQENVSFGVIGNKLGKDRTTIAKEIKKHSCGSMKKMVILILISKLIQNGETSGMTAS